MTTIADGIQYLLHHTEGSREGAKRFVHDTLDNGPAAASSDADRIVWALARGLGWRDDQAWEAEASIHRAIDHH